jgi:hypothetical protein
MSLAFLFIIIIVVVVVFAIIGENGSLTGSDNVRRWDHFGHAPFAGH